MPIPDLNSRHILLIRTDRLGDVILSTPVATALKKAFPQSRISFLVREYTRPVVESCPAVDDILVVDPFTGANGRLRTRHLARFLQEREVDAAIHLFPRASLAWATYLAKIPLRVGTGFRLYSFLFNRRLYEHRKTAQFHEAEYNLHLLKLLGLENLVVEFCLRVNPSAAASMAIKARDAGLEVEGDFVVMHPGSGGSSRDWPVESFARLADLIMDRHHLPVVITGDRKDAAIIRRLKSLMRRKPIDFGGRLSLQELAALLKQASLFISNSTGPLHLAVALDTEVLAFYPPIRECRPQRWGPYGRPDDVLMSQTEECFRCRKSSNRWCECMQRITVDAAYDKVSRKLAYTLNRKYPTP